MELTGNIISWAIGIPLIAYSIYTASYNFWLRFILSRRLKPGEHTPSPIIMVGALMGMGGLFVLPIPEAHWYVWLPLVLDIGALPLLVTVWLSQRGDASQVKTSTAEKDIAPIRHRAMSGCLLGTAVGDAIALPFEGLSKRRVGRWLRGPLQHRFFFGRGFCSDDTEHTCMVAQALLTARMEIDRKWFLHVFAHNLAWRFRFWLLGLPAGIGLATLRSILKQWAHPLAHAEGVNSAGNAPAMRSAILGVCHGDDPQLLRELVRASTRLTHTDPRAEDGALAVAWAAHCACQPEIPTPTSFLASLTQKMDSPDSALLAAVAEAVSSLQQGEGTFEFAARIGCANGVSGFVMHTVPVALHVWLTHPEDFVGALETVVRCGGDTDTVGAIVGALVGTRVGPEGIPVMWRNHLWEWPRSKQWLNDLAVRLAETRPERQWRGALPLSLLSLLLRNLLFMLWVLAHGFRRLLPPY